MECVARDTLGMLQILSVCGGQEEEEEEEEEEER